MPVPEEIARYYEAYREDLRLASGIGALELARTQEVLGRHLPAPPAVVLDVGGGPGVYSAWLAARGYQVHLVEPVGKHVEMARELGPRIASVTQGEGGALNWPGESADALLLFGPLYHLTERAERLAALREAGRVARRGGVIFCAAINRFASLLDGLTRALIDDPVFEAILERDLEDGQHRNPTSNLEYFTTAFFHHPDELAAEIVEAGLKLVELVGVEGPAWLVEGFERRWQDAAQRAQLLWLARRLEREPALLGLSPHLLAVARA